MRMMKSLLQTVAITMILATSCIVAQAESLKPISEYLHLPEDRRDKAYPFVRCIGLFQAVFRYGGANFSDEDALKTEMGNQAMGLIALMLRLDRYADVSPDDLAEQIGKEVEDTTVVYHDRMATNYTLTGEAYGSDATILDDFNTCRDMAAASLDRVQNLE